MAAGNFQRCLASTLEFEGGWSNHPADPGGATMRGVIQTVYNSYRDSKSLPRQTVRNISEAELQEIYRKRYWDLVNGEKLAAGVDLATFDFGVNSGPSRANRYLANIPIGKPADTAKKLCQARLAFVRALGTFSVFGKGWTRRIVTTEARSVKMALAADGRTPDQVRDTLQGDAAAANKKAKQQGTGAAGTATGGGGVGSQIDPSTLDTSSTVGLVIVGVIIAVVVAFLLYRAWTNQQRAKAYKAVAQEQA